MLNLKTGKQFTEPSARSQMTRGGFLKGILASGIAPSITLGAIASAGSANASVGGAARGMMRNVGARNAAMFGWKQTAKDYVQNGLISMFDAVENVDWGKNDRKTTKWKDLIGRFDVDVYSTYEMPFEELYFKGTKDNYVLSSLFSQTSSSVATIEVVFSVDRRYSQWEFLTIPMFQSRYEAMQFGFTSNDSYGRFYCGFEKTNRYRIPMVDISKFNTFSIVNSASITLGFLNGTSSGENLLIEYSRYSKLLRIPSIEYINTSVLKVSSIRLYERKLSEFEISHNYAIDKARFNLR